MTPSKKLAEIVLARDEAVEAYQEKLARLVVHHHESLAKLLDALPKLKADALAALIPDLAGRLEDTIPKMVLSLAEATRDELQTEQTDTLAVLASEAQRTRDEVLAVVAEGESRVDGKLASLQSLAAKITEVAETAADLRARELLASPEAKQFVQGVIDEQPEAEPTGTPDNVNVMVSLFKGTFTPGDEAKRGELWLYNGSTYICTANTDMPPRPGPVDTEMENWAMFAAAGRPGAPGTSSSGGGASLPDQTGNNGKFLTTDGSAASWGTPAGAGDVVGPASATDAVPVLFDGTTGKLVKNSAPTGTGVPVMANTPTLITPVLGVATVTTVNKLTLTQPATGSTLTIAEGKTLTASNTVTLTATDGSTLAIGTGGTLGTAAYTAATAYQAADADLTTWAGITPGANVGTALAVAVGTDGAFVVKAGALGTPNGGTLTNCTGLPTAGIVDDAVTYAKIQNVSATSRVLGRIAGGAGDVEELTGANIKTIAAITPADFGAGVLAANMTLGEADGQIVLDAALSATEKFSGILEVVTAGETLAIGELVYFKAADSRWWKTDADASATAGPVKIGICVTTGAAAGALTVLLWGKVRVDAVFPAMTVGAPLYVGLTAGAIAVTETWGTDDVIRIIGHANTADELFFHPSNDYITYV